MDKPKRLEMNTAQLAVLWYAGLGTAAAILFFQDDAVSVSSVVLVIIVIASLLVFSFREHPAARKWIVLSVVLVPPVVVGLIVVFISAYNNYLRSPASLKEIPAFPITVEVFDGKASFDEGPTYSFERRTGVRARTANITGRVNNGSAMTLRFLKLRIDLHEKDSKKEVDGSLVSVWLAVPPGETRSFSANVAG